MTCPLCDRRNDLNTVANLDITLGWFMNKGNELRLYAKVERIQEKFDPRREEGSHRMPPHKGSAKLRPRAQAIPQKRGKNM
jgi:hypothetical protein